MQPLPLGEIARLVGGSVRHASEAVVVSRVVTDSRQCGAGDLFVAIEGANHDGHDHAAGAVAAGAAAVLVSRDVSVPSVLVSDDTVSALGRLASGTLTRVPGRVVVAVTGSNGKTSTKDLIASVLPQERTVVTQGNFNNEIGLPLTVLRADDDTRILVLEMGMRGLGHIRGLTEIAPPTIGVVLNVGTAHMEMVGGTPEGVAAAKAELVQALRPGGIAVLNADDQRVLAMRDVVDPDVRIVTFGESESADVRATDVVIRSDGGASFTLHHGTEHNDVALRLVGVHHVSNALAAAAVGLALGEHISSVASRLSDAQPVSRWRMEVTRRPDGVVVINDAYNANPESMRAALRALVSLERPAGSRTWAVLGGMLELGPTSIDEHDRLGRLAVRLDVSRLVCVGTQARVIHLGAVQEGSWGEESTWVPDPESALSLVRNDVRPGDVVLVKASRSIGLESVAIGLVEAAP